MKSILRIIMVVPAAVLLAIGFVAGFAIINIIADVTAAGEFIKYLGDSK